MGVRHGSPSHQQEPLSILYDPEAPAVEYCYNTNKKNVYIFASNVLKKPISYLWMMLGQHGTGGIINSLGAQIPNLSLRILSFVDYRLFGDVALK